MLRKIWIFLFLSAGIQLHGIGYEDQLNHIKSEMRILKRAWQAERIHIKQAQKTAPALYLTLKTTIDKILASEMFTTKLDSIVANQLESMVNHTMSFNSIKVAFNIADFFPNTTMHDFGRNLFSAMANKAYYVELGKRLAQKVQELQVIIANTSPQ